MELVTPIKVRNRVPGNFRSRKSGVSRVRAELPALRIWKIGHGSSVVVFVTGIVGLRAVFRALLDQWVSVEESLSDHIQN